MWRWIVYVQGQKRFIIPYVRLLAQSRAITYRGQLVTLGKAGDYICSHFGFLWIESEDSVRRYYRSTGAIGEGSFFGLIPAYRVRRREAFYVRSNGKHLYTGCPEDTLVVLGSRITFLLLYCGVEREPEIFPLYINTAVKDTISITSA